MNKDYRNNLGMSRYQVQDLFNGEDVTLENGMTYKVVDKELTDNDTEKGSYDYDVVIEEYNEDEIKTGNFYRANLGESPWHMQGEVNAEQKWSKVEQKSKMTYYYE